MKLVRLGDVPAGHKFFDQRTQRWYRLSYEWIAESITHNDIAGRRLVEFDPDDMVEITDE